MDEINTTEIFVKAREAADKFQETVTDIFLKDDENLKSLTLKYGIF